MTEDELNRLAQRNDESFAEMQKQIDSIDWSEIDVSASTEASYSHSVYNGDVFPWAQDAYQMLIDAGWVRPEEK